MIVHPSIEGRDIFADGRFPGYQAALEKERSDYDKRMRRIGCDPRVMDRCAGAIEALDFALGKPSEMKDSDPAESAT